jgi:HSP20 family molecular chaperone IbpA
MQVKLAKPDSETTHQTVENKSQLCLPSNATNASDTTTKTVEAAGSDTTLTADVNSQRRRYDDNNQPEYYRDEDQVTWCRLRFDVSGYDPGDISVRVEGNRKLIVCARHVQSAAIANGTKTDSVTRQMSKTVDVPRGVRPDRITSYLSRDGYLHVIAPVNQSQMSAVSNGSGDDEASWKLPRECEFRPIHQPPEAAAAATSLSGIGHSNSNALVEVDHDDITTNRNIARTGGCYFCDIFPCHFAIIVSQFINGDFRLVE